MKELSYMVEYLNGLRDRVDSKKEWKGVKCEEFNRGVEAAMNIIEDDIRLYEYASSPLRILQI